MNKEKNWFLFQINKALLTPVRALKKRYIPLLLVYFSYGLSGFSAIALSFWEKETLSLSTEQLISISVWVMVPWTLKMVFGQMVDSVSLFGSNRKGYIFLGAIFMIIGAVLLAGLAGRYEWIMLIGSEYTIYLLSAVFTTFGFVIQDVTADTMSTEVVERTEIKEGKLIERAEKSVQGDLAMVQVLGRLALSLAIFLVAGLGGWLATNFSYEAIFWATMIIPVISCIGVLFVKLEKVKEHERKPVNLKILGGGLAFAVFSVVMAVINHPFSQEIVFGVSLVLLSFMLYWVTRDIPKKKFKILLFTMIALFLYRATALMGVGPGLNWWTIDVLGFDQAFFGILAQIGAGVALLVLWFFSDFIANRPVRSVLIFLVFFGAIMSLPELGLFYRVHEFLGLDAKTIALFDTALGSPLAHISMVPLLALIAFYAPAGYRGTWFAIGASLMNLALTAGNLLTKYLNRIFVITREVLDETGEVLVSQNYEDLGILMICRLVLSFVIPFLAILFFLRKTPKTSQVEAIVDISDEAPIPSRKNEIMGND